MNNLFKFLPAVLLLLCTSCSKDEPASTSAPSGITLAAEELSFDPGATATLRITVEPADAAVKAEDFSVVDAQTGKAPVNVRLQSVTKVSAGIFDMVLRDNGSKSKYTEALKIVCAAAKSTSAPLTVRSTPYLPVVRITTQTPQNQITKDTWVAGTVAIDGGNGFEDLEQMATQVKGRGNTTWGWKKKPYALKLDSKTEVLGMPKHKRWCLIANYMDRTHLRNRVAYYIGQNSKLAYTVRNEYVELYFNDQYQGLYLLTEQIKVDKNRVDVTEMEATDNTGDAVTGGYLIEMDTNYDEDRKFRSASTDIPVNIKSPDPEDMTDEQFNYIRDYVNRVDAAVYAKGAGTDPFTLLDRESMIDFWICFEVMANHEILHPKSIYFHKERGGKLVAGPIWDFDYETLVSHTQTNWINYNLSYVYNEYPWYENNWWNLLLKNDASFRADLKKRWQEWYPVLKTVPDFIDREQKAIAKAVVRDNARWPSIEGTGNPNRDESLSFSAAVDRLKQVYTTRVEWMNNQIANW